MCTGGEPWPLAVRETGVQPGEAPLKAGSNPDSLNGGHLPPSKGSNIKYYSGYLGRAKIGLKGKLECLEGYISGIVDAEGSFSVSLKKQRDVRCKIRIQPVFSVTQENRDVLITLKEYFGCGRIIEKPGQPHLHLFIIDSLNNLSGTFINKAIKLKLIAKKRQLEIFVEIIKKLNDFKYNRYDCCKIRELITMSYQLSKLNSKSKRRSELHEIIRLIPCNEAEEPPGER